MSWRATLLGAVVVVIAGVAAGAAIGGKTTTRTQTATDSRTVTVVKTVTTTKPATTTGTTTTGPTTRGPTTTGPGATTPTSTEKYLSDYLEEKGGPETLDRTAEDASLVSNPDRQELAGQTYQHAVAFEIDGQSESLRATYQIPSPGFSRLSAIAAGLQTTANANASYQLTVYKNDDTSPRSVVLYEGSFRGPSTVRKLSFTLRGATDLLFVWTHKAPEPDTVDNFILADPVLAE